MNVTIHPTKLKGTVKVPPSKSLSHRALIAAALAKGHSTLYNVLWAKDTDATMLGMQALGARFVRDGDTIEVHGSKVKRHFGVINAKESGSTIRFLIPVALTNNEAITFTGEGRLAKRPLNVYFDIFDEQNIQYNKGENDLPLTVKGALMPSVYDIKGDVSSQFISGLLFALPILSDRSYINITTPLESKGYVDLTLDVLKHFGIIVQNEHYRHFIVPGNQFYTPTEYTVEGDFSQAAFWLVAGTIGDGLTLAGMQKASAQGDREIIDIINAMGGEVSFEDDLLVAKKKKTKGTIIDLSQAPDLGPILTVLAAVSEGKTEIINASRLRIKESDRITAIATELRKCGATIEEREDGMVIEGKPMLKGNVTVDSWNDHRIAMALAIASIRCDGPITITNAECIDKSYPTFYDDFKALKGMMTHE